MIIWHVGGGGGGYGKAQELAESVGARITVFEANVDRREEPFAQVRDDCLGDFVGLTNFYIYEYEPCSSLFKINPAHAGEITGNPKLRTWGDHGALRQTRVVQMRTVDHLLTYGAMVSQPLMERPDFLSLDAQGAEYKIFCGAKRTLPSILGILAEFQTAKVYLGQGLFHDQSHILHEHGFRLADIIYREYWHRGGTKLLTSGDALFLNYGDHLTPEQIAMRDRIASFFGLRDERASIDALEGAP